MEFNKFIIFFMLLSLLFAIYIIFASNTVYSVLCLVGVFFSVFVVLICSRVEYFAFTILIVYIGAVSILFLFVVMMLGPNIEKSVRTDYSFSELLFYLFSVISVSSLFYFFWHQMALVSNISKKVSISSEFVFYVLSNDILAVGSLLFGTHYYLVWLTGGILLVAMVCSLILALNAYKK